MSGKYTNRTCSCCGIRKPQPQMYSRIEYTTTGRSKTSISGATILGAMFEDKRSINSIRSTLFNSGQRTYQRKRTVWYCGSCVPAKQKPTMSAKTWMIVVAAAVFAAGFIGGLK